MAKRQTSQFQKNGQNPNPIPKKEDNYLELIGEQGKELERQGKLLNWTFGFIVAILIVCFVAIVTFLLDAWKFHQESYLEFTKILEQVNTKLITPSPTFTYPPKR